MSPFISANEPQTVVPTVDHILASYPKSSDKADSEITVMFSLICRTLSLCTGFVKTRRLVACEKSKLCSAKIDFTLGIASSEPISFELHPTKFCQTEMLLTLNLALS
jgi:hypothetical protein